MYSRRKSTVSRIPIFRIIIVHDRNWKINAEKCSIFICSISTFLAKVRHDFFTRERGGTENGSVRNAKTCCFTEKTRGPFPRREIPAGTLEWYIIQLLWRKSFVECEQIGFWCGKESFFSVKIKNTSCVLQPVVLVCISVKIGCFGGFCRKMYLFPPCENQNLPISIFGF